MGVKNESAYYMLENEFKINQYIWIERTCSLCGGVYKVRTGKSGGGQKSGMSPAVHVSTYYQNGRLITGSVIGFCSSQCLTEWQGADIRETLAYKAIACMGIDPMIYIGRNK